MRPPTKDTDFLVVIPARYASSRFPGKALADLGGMTVLHRCVEQVRLVVPHDQIIVATDDERIADECRRHDTRYEMTSPTCLTGTDRVAEVARRLAAEWYVNVQGDEPFLDPTGLRAIIDATRDSGDDVSVINASAPIIDETDFRSTTVPKVVNDAHGRLLYMSRAAIPTTKQLEFVSARRQVGLYAFRSSALRTFANHATKTPLEALEDIEILRFIELGISVRMIEVPSVGIAIDTPEDLVRARRHLERA